MIHFFPFWMLAGKRGEDSYNIIGMILQEKGDESICIFLIGHKITETGIPNAPIEIIKAEEIIFNQSFVYNNNINVNRRRYINGNDRNHT